MGFRWNAYAGERRPSFADSPLSLSLVFIGCNRVITVIMTPPTLNTARFFVACVHFYFTSTLFTRMQSIRDVDMAIFHCYYKTLKRCWKRYTKKVNKIKCSVSVWKTDYIVQIILVRYKSMSKKKNVKISIFNFKWFLEDCWKPKVEEKIYSIKLLDADL